MDENAAALAFARSADVRAESSYDGGVKARNGEQIHQIHLEPAGKRTLRSTAAPASRAMPRQCMDQRLQKTARQLPADP